ncbi:YebC/PmpR family DNA-binding transcriptional regulator [bacterium CG17_big_fil_post_rev_8_21_14_2_50_64_8]|nr:MAG: YebC/PmpR family DNA-binding transcriptional regulator [bacterium CG17_big_fil_post_rev_8_21_14_2_50_64_8]PJA75706.1 MAG: YebC/PmpR family DNA-binding transcriptional regulator [bacterium CG_4_9_14_3_um_filter_65_15]
MSGHSKWANIKHRKGAQDAKRAKVFTRLIRELTIAAREGGGDPESNSRLRSAITTARGSNMSNDTIEKAIKRGTGEGGGVVFEEVNYEGYGPGGVAILVECQTDNKNRTTAEVRHAFTKFNGNLGANGCVSYIFDRKGVIRLDGERCDLEAVMEAAIEAGAEDVGDEEGAIVVTTAMEDLNNVGKALTDAGLPLLSAELNYLPNTSVQVERKDALSLMKLINLMDDLDDVSNVSANFDMDDDLMAEIEEQLG